MQTPPVESGAPGVLPLIEFASAPPVATEDGKTDIYPVERDLMDAPNSHFQGVLILGYRDSGHLRWGKAWMKVKLGKK